MKCRWYVTRNTTALCFCCEGQCAQLIRGQAFVVKVVECMRDLKWLETLFAQPRFSKNSSLFEENQRVVNNQELVSGQGLWYLIHFINNGHFSVLRRKVSQIEVDLKMNCLQSKIYSNSGLY